MFRWFVEYKFVAVLLSAPLPTLKLTAKFFLPEAVEQILEYLIHPFIHSLGVFASTMQVFAPLRPSQPTFMFTF